MATFPDFSLPASDGSTIARSDLDGPYVMYFYPKDLTPGCTTEACDFRDNLDRITAKGVRVFGVSADPIARHETFIAKHALNFLLLSDADTSLMNDLGVWQEKRMYGKTYMGVVRSTFLVDTDHTILREWRQVRVKGHVDEVLAAIDDVLKE